MCILSAEPDNLAFLDFNIKVNSSKQYNCNRYKKPTDRALS